MKSARRTNNRSSYAASPNAWIGWPARSQSEKAKKATIHRFAAVRAVRPCKRDNGMVVRSILAFRKLAAAPARRAARARGSRESYPGKPMQVYHRVTKTPRAPPHEGRLGG